MDNTIKEDVGAGCAFGKVNARSQDKESAVFLALVL